MNKIVVIGSSNTDMVIKTNRLPLPGQIIADGQFMMTPGGKGANQAVAIARLGGRVSFITKTGNDLFGRQSLELYKSEGIVTDYVFSDTDNPSGVALILVDSSGEKCISIAQGAIRTLSIKDIEKARREIENASLLLMELEIPMETVEYVAKIALAKGVKIILNPSPIKVIPEKLLKLIQIIIPNKVEAEMLTGIRVSDWMSARKAADRIHKKGVETVIITLGSMGALVLENGTFHQIAAEKVNAIDTTAVGDTFCGAFCVGLTEGMSIVEAVKLACKAAAITVTRRGMQASIPHRIELKK
ncbi:MAG: ribokinase [Dysgonamonadaceae bacterium]|jgi:ribokinase|nr:ribokinase [Dysgonamonadaceae bacterium]